MAPLGPRTPRYSMLLFLKVTNTTPKGVETDATRGLRQATTTKGRTPTDATAHKDPFWWKIPISVASSPHLSFWEELIETRKKKIHKRRFSFPRHTPYPPIAAAAGSEGCQQSSARTDLRGEPKIQSLQSQMKRLSNVMTPH
ncbi:hypothetical protein EVAR_64919_1 [Eumeta japonica]|uniref:Uncharacterized protein n=1 Tax=Eumeta variegata TaxID=151549 RepID=A0A4C1ZJ21_EUMVA|nr:hypothetical protein EVAR_64919_1 [Eumeta japonica]